MAGDGWHEDGYTGLADRRKGKPSAKRVPLATVEKVLGLYQETYYDLNIRHFHEKLQEEHEIELSYTWVQKALQGAGLVAKRHKRGPHRRRRPRRPMPGMLLHIDGSKHQWLNDERWYDLIVILDDATSEIYYAQLVEEESTRTVMAGLREVIEDQGLFCALYSDRGSHFFVTPKAGEKVDKHRLTQVGRAMKELGVQMIPAYSPQARGPVGAQFRNLAGAAAAGTAAGRDHHRGRGQWLSAGAVHCGVQQQVHGAGGRERHGISAHQPDGPELDLHACRPSGWWTRTTRWRSETGPGKSRRPGSAAPWPEHGDDPRAPGRDGLDPLRTACSGTLRRDGEKLRPANCARAPWKRREHGSRRKPKAGFHRLPPPLEISPKARDSHFPTAPTTVFSLATRKAKTKTKTPKAAA